MTEIDLTGLLIKLAQHNITGIQVYYAGGGDSGSVENIIYTTEKLNEDDNLAYDELDELSRWPSSGSGKLPAGDLNELDSSLYSLVEDFASNTILDNIEDWWNNEGGYGTLLILVPSGEYQVRNNVYVTHTENYLHDGKLTDHSRD